MIANFKNKATEDVFNGVASKAARKTCPQSLWSVATRKLDQLDSAEALAGSRSGEHSIRINEQYRICFRWGAQGPENVEVVDYH